MPRSTLDIPRLHSRALWKEPAEHAHREPAHDEERTEDDRDRCGVARPLRANTLAEPEDAEARQHRADAELHPVLRDGGERMAEDGRERDDDRADPVPFGLLQPLGPELGDLSAIDLILVVQGDDAREAQHRLAQPAQPKEQEQRAHEAEEELLGYDGDQRHAERGHDDRQRRGRERGADERCAPAARETDREHDRRRLDELDRARDEGWGRRDGEGDHVHPYCSTHTSLSARPVRPSGPGLKSWTFVAIASTRTWLITPTNGRISMIFFCASG